MASSNTSAFNLSKPVKQLIIFGGLILAILIIVIVAFTTVNGTRDEGISKSNSLEAQYVDNQNELSSYILTFNETLGIADRQSQKLNDILLEAVKGRYDGDLEMGGEMFTVISEAYPDLTSTAETYSKVQDAVIDGRDAYKNKQSKLIDMVRDYEDWLEKGLFKSQLVEFLGFPDDYLEVETASGTLTGEEALDQIKSLVLADEARDAYETGTMEPLISPTD